MKGTALKERIGVSQKSQAQKSIPYGYNAVEFKFFQEAWKQPCIMQFTK